MSLDNVTGFDLFIDLLRTAKLVDSFTNRVNSYVVADMTGEWPFETIFDTVICGLVCHHLKKQSDIIRFFLQANRVLKPAGSLLITFPSGSISKISYLNNLLKSIEQFGFKVNRELSGLVLSKDSSHSLFWMFCIIAEKVSGKVGKVFLSPDFIFPQYRTPVTRKEKGARVKETAKSIRTVKHEHFTLITCEELEKKVSDKTLVYSTVSKLYV